MPELPEVETIRRQLAPIVEGARIEKVEILDPRWCEPERPRDVTAALHDRRVATLRRRGKYLIWDLDGPPALVTHLRMTGTLLCDPPAATPYVRVRIRLETVKGAHRVIAFSDPRRFGTGRLLADADAQLDERLGVEPLAHQFTPQRLRDLTRGRRAPIKALLLDQRRIAGIGNIYADEALYMAGIHPLKPAGRLRGSEHERLRDAIVGVLKAGIDARGATIDDFRHVDGVQGSFQHQFAAHRRAGEPCARCGAEIVKIVAAGRGTYLCPGCQPPSRATSSSRRPLAAAAVVFFYTATT